MDIRTFIEKYEDATVVVGNKTTYNQREIINKVHQMLAGQFTDKYFQDGETKKLYFNVIMGFCQALRRGSKLRISEFSLTSVNGAFLKMVDLLKMAFKHFLRFNGWNETRDEVQAELIEMGHVLTKVVDGETKVVDLRNVVFRPNAKTLKEDGCVEKRYLTYEEAKAEFGGNKHWKEIKDFYEANKEKTDLITFNEHWKIDEFDGEETKGCVVYLDKSGVEDPDEYAQADEWSPYLEVDRFVSPHEVKTSNKRERRIYGEKKRVFPYDEQRLIEIPGRYLGMGAYEMCLPAQEDYNEKRNYKRKFDRLALRGILVHKVGNLRQKEDGDALTQEFLKRLDTGAAVKIFSDETLERLNIGSATAETIAMTNDLFEFMRFMLGVTPIAIGETASNKTASFAIIQNQNQQSTYQAIKTKTARLFERLFQDFLLDDVVEELLRGDIIGLYGDEDDLDELDKFVASHEVNSALNRRPTAITPEAGQQAIKERAGQYQRMGETQFMDIRGSKVKQAFRKLLGQIDYIVEFNIG